MERWIPYKLSRKAQRDGGPTAYNLCLKSDGKGVGISIIFVVRNLKIQKHAIRMERGNARSNDKIYG